MKAIFAMLVAGAAAGAIAVAHAKLPPPTAEQKAAAAEKAQKADAAKAKTAEQVRNAQDKAVANYKKNKGKAK